MSTQVVSLRRGWQPMPAAAISSLSSTILTSPEGWQLRLRGGRGVAAKAWWLRRGVVKRARLACRVVHHSQRGGGALAHPQLLLKRSLVGEAEVGAREAQLARQHLHVNLAVDGDHHQVEPGLEGQRR